MARYTYAATPADYVIDGATGLPKAGVTVTVFNAIAAGAQVTDLLNAAGSPVTSLTTAADGSFRFSGPDGTSTTLFVSVAGSSSRYAVFPSDVASRPQLPAGGTTNQIVKKNSNADYDFGFAAQSSTSLTSPATVTAAVASDVPLTVAGAASQTADVFDVKNSSAALLLGVAAGGQVKIGSGAPTTGTLRIQTASTSERGIVVKQRSSQTSKPIEVVDSADAVVFSVGTDGTVAGPNIGVKVIVLNSADTVPTGTPAGTVILRRP